MKFWGGPSLESCSAWPWRCFERPVWWSPACRRRCSRTRGWSASAWWTSTCRTHQSLQKVKAIVTRWISNKLNWHSKEETRAKGQHFSGHFYGFICGQCPAMYWKYRKCIKYRTFLVSINSVIGLSSNARRQPFQATSGCQSTWITNH